MFDFFIKSDKLNTLWEYLLIGGAIDCGISPQLSCLTIAQEASKIRLMPQVKCKICGKEFYAKPNWLKRGWGKYCSVACSHKGARKGKFIFCHICGKKTWKTPKALKISKSGKFFCGKSCQATWRNRTFVGPKHALWKGGSYQEYGKILTKSNLPIKCTSCGTSDKRVLSVHHKDRKRNNNSIDNLEWLCFNCHFLTHHYPKTE